MAFRSSDLMIEARNQKQYPGEGSSLHGEKNQSFIADRLWQL